MRVSRRAQTLPNAPDHGEHDAAQVLFKQYFESQYEAIEDPPRLKEKNDIPWEQVSSDDTEDDWDGFSNEEVEEPVIVDCGIAATQTTERPLQSKWSFMNSRPPAFKEQPTSTETREIEPSREEKAERETANLKQDVALQRLLRESNLLNDQTSLTPTGKNRLRALDIRLQDLGSSSSAYAQGRMPLSHRRGIQAKSILKEKERRKTAKENGIILEKAVTGSKKAVGRRTRSVDTPSVGRFQRGMLTLSKNDIAAIKGPKPFSKNKK